MKYLTSFLEYFDNLLRDKKIGEDGIYTKISDCRENKDTKFPGISIVCLKGIAEAGILRLLPAHEFLHNQPGQVCCGSVLLEEHAKDCCLGEHYLRWGSEIAQQAVEINFDNSIRNSLAATISSKRCMVSNLLSASSSTDSVDGPTLSPQYCQRVVSTCRDILEFVEEVCLLLISILPVAVTAMNTSSLSVSPGLKSDKRTHEASFEGIYSATILLGNFVEDTLCARLMSDLPAPPLISARLWCAVVERVLRCKNAVAALLLTCLQLGRTDNVTIENALKCLEATITDLIGGAVGMSVYCIDTRFIDDTVMQDWMGSHAFRPGVHVSYGVMAATIHIRGFISDVLQTLSDHPNFSFRLILRLLGALVGTCLNTYRILDVSRVRLQQIKRDMNFLLWAVKGTFSYVSDANIRQSTFDCRWLEQLQRYCILQYRPEVLAPFGQTADLRHEEAIGLSGFSLLESGWTETEDAVGTSEFSLSLASLLVYNFFLCAPSSEVIWALETMVLVLENNPSMEAEKSSVNSAMRGVVRLQTPDNSNDSILNLLGAVEHWPDTSNGLGKRSGSEPYNCVADWKILSMKLSMLQSTVDSAVKTDMAQLTVHLSVLYKVVIEYSWLAAVVRKRFEMIGSTSGTGNDNYPTLTPDMLEFRRTIETLLEVRRSAGKETLGHVVIWQEVNLR